MSGLADPEEKTETLRATNIRLRWSREEREYREYYKHSAPLEPGGEGMPLALRGRVKVKVEPRPN
jgi:hypothetical protein